jgi:oligosaccharide repeat unit polymerase
MNNFPRPIRKAVPPVPPPKRAEVPAAAEPSTEWVHPWPRVDATFVALVGLIITAFAMANSGGRFTSHLAHTTAIGVLVTLLASFAFEARGGLKNLIRPDLVGILALYYLTLYEFLFPQPYFDKNISDIHAVYLALWAVIIGFIGLFIGRHLVPRGKQPFAEVMTRPVPPGWLVTILWVCFFAGFLHVVLAVNFDLSKMLEAMLRARFEQPWGRARLGDWKALLHELELVLYLVPPIFGLMLGKRERYSSLSLLLAGIAFVWLLFFGFAAGTRTVFAAYLITFLIAFTFSSPPQRKLQVIAMAVICGGMMVMATRVMLDMRTIGLKRYLEGEKQFIVTRQNSSVFVDDNLYAIAVLAQYFPNQNGGRYLGFEIPWLALIRPIPRAIWPGKPVGMSVSIEQVFNTKGVTIAATFVGEAYMSGGLFAVALEGMILGILATYWNRFSSAKNSELGLLVYSSGFFAVTITMRSCFALTTALLPSLAGIVIGKFLLPKIRGKLKPRPVVPPRLRGKPGNPPPVSE